MKLKCKIDGCESVINLDGMATSPEITYECRNHTPAVAEPHFQECQFDKDLRRAAKPIGTNHIIRQGEPADTEEERQAWADIQGESKKG